MIRFPTIRLRWLPLVVLPVLTMAGCLHLMPAQELGKRQWLPFGAEPLSITLAALLIARRLAPAIRLKNVRNIFDFALSLSFVAIIAWPLLHQIAFAPKSLAYAAAKASQQRGPAAFIKTFRGAFETYERMHFHGASRYLSLNGAIKLYCLGVTPDKRVITGQNGYFYEGAGKRTTDRGKSEEFDNIADYLGQEPFTATELRQWKIALEQRALWLNNLGADYVFVLAPSKALVYPEFLPESLKRRGAPSGSTGRYQQFSSYLKEYAHIHLIDLLPPLLTVKNSQSQTPLFYKMDFHWNSYGAFVAYKAMNEAMQSMFPGRAPDPPMPGSFSVIWGNRIFPRIMDILQLPRSLYIREQISMLRPHPGGRYDHVQPPLTNIYDGIIAPNKKIATTGGTVIVDLVENPTAKLGEIILLGDSFLEKCLYFFAGDSKRLIYQRAVAHFPAVLLAAERPNLVIQEALAMYLLRQPPVNPEQVTAGYFSWKFSGNPDKSIFRAGKPDSWDGREAVFTLNLPKARDGEVRSTRLILDGVRAGISIKACFFGQDGEAWQEAELHATSGENAIFFSAPAEDIATLRLRVRKGDEPIFGALEVRSDLPAAKKDLTAPSPTITKGFFYK